MSVINHLIFFKIKFTFCLIISDCSGKIAAGKWITENAFSNK